MGHHLSHETVGEIVALRSGGAGLREIARLLGISTNTVSRYLPTAKVQCGCGLDAGHKGWCTSRLAKSERRRAYVSGHVVPPRAPVRSRVREAVAEKRIWLGLDPFNGRRLPDDERIGAIGQINRLTARFRLDVRDDIRQEMIVSCFEGRCPREDLERAVLTFWGFVSRGFVWREEATSYDVGNLFYAGNLSEAA